EEQRIRGNEEAGGDAPGIACGGAPAGAGGLRADGRDQLLSGHGRGHSLRERSGRPRQSQRLQDERRRLRADATHRCARHEPGPELVGGRHQDHLYQPDRSGGAGRGLRDGGGRFGRAEPDQYPEQRRGLCLLAREQQVRLRQRSRRRPVRCLSHDPRPGRADHGPHAPDHERCLRFEPPDLPRRQEAGLRERPRRGRFRHLPDEGGARGSEQPAREDHQEPGQRLLPGVVPRRDQAGLREGPAPLPRGDGHEGRARGQDEPARQPLQEPGGRRAPGLVARRQEGGVPEQPRGARRHHRLRRLAGAGRRRRQPQEPHQRPRQRHRPRLAAAAV
ncbi:MAG: tolB protein precursor, periplasmic protein involved in the tonb-independent uptake of group A colicins, partial [uncultured Rubrobacteraceae bacterium]